MCTTMVCWPHTIYRETFEEENFHEFRGFVAIRESFLREIWDVAFFGTAQASNLQKLGIYTGGRWEAWHFRWSAVRGAI